jgi:hypothetical protein
VANSSLRDRLYNEHDIGFAKAADLQGAGWTAPVINTPPFSTRLLSQPLNLPDRLSPSVTVSASSLLNIGEDDPVTIDISYFTTAKILDKRSSPVWSRVQVRVRAGVVILSLGERDTDGRRSHPELRKWTYTSRPSGDIKG